MPKSKSRRKKQKKNRKKSVSPRHGGKKSPEVVYKHTKIEDPAFKLAKPKKKKLLETLYADQALGMFQLVSVSPFFFGAWLAGGIELSDILAFFVASLSLILAVYTPNLRRSEFPFRNELYMILYVAQFLIPLWFYGVTKSVLGLFLLVASCGLHALGGLLTLDTPRSILLRATQTIFSMTLLAMLGVFTQSFRLDIGVSPIFGILGFVPSCVLASAYIAKYCSVFEQAGWKRSYTRVKKDGEIAYRPAGISRLYSLPFIIGPGLPVAVAPLGLLPYSFLLCALAFWKAPDLLEGFFRKQMSDSEVAIRTVTLAAVMSLVVFVAGLIAGT